MNEMSINWGRLGVIIVGLLSLTLVTVLILRRGAEQDALVSSFMTLSKGNTVTERQYDPSRMVYTNKELGFSLELPKAWNGYRVLMTETPEYNEKIVSISLPAESFKDNLKEPKNLKHGVMLIGIRAIPRGQTGDSAPSDQSGYLGMNKQYRLYAVPLDAFQNGFKTVPEDLVGEIAGVYASFRTE